MIKFSLLDYSDQAEPVKKALDFLKEEGWADATPGQHKLGDTGILVNVFDRNSIKQEDAKWELHKKFIDVQLMVRGKELIEFADIKSLELGEYIEARDFMGATGAAESVMDMNEETGYVIFPEDGHKPGISPDGSCAQTKRVCVKIPVDMM